MVLLTSQSLHSKVASLATLGTAGVEDHVGFLPGKYC